MYRAKWLLIIGAYGTNFNPDIFPCERSQALGFHLACNSYEPIISTLSPIICCEQSDWTKAILSSTNIASHPMLARFKCALPNSQVMCRQTAVNNLSSYPARQQAV